MEINVFVQYPSGCLSNRELGKRVRSIGEKSNLLSLHRTFKNSVFSFHVSVVNDSLFNLPEIV